MARRLPTYTLLLVIGLTLGLFLAMLWVMVLRGAGGDYSSQVLDAVLVFTGDEGRFARPNQLFNRSVVALTAVVPGATIEQRVSYAAIVVALLHYVLTSLAIFVLLRPYLPPTRLARAAALVISVLSLQVLAPLVIFDLTALAEWQEGYIATATYHNPTSVLAKFYALPQLFLTLAIFRQDDQRANWGTVALAALVTFLSLQAKPAYTMALLPVLVLAVPVWYWGWHRPVDWRLLIGGCLLVAVPMLALQYLGVFVDENANVESSVLIAPFLYYQSVNEATLLLPLKWLLSLAFPIAVTLGHWAQARRDGALLLAWAVTGMGIFQMVLLAESGENLPFGNFTWGAQYAVFVLFVLALCFWLQRRWSGDRHLSGVYAALFAAHGVFGIIAFVWHLGRGVV